MLNLSRMSTGRLTVIGLSGLVLIGAVLVAGMLIGQQAMAPVEGLNGDAADGNAPVEGETGTPTPSPTGEADLSSPPEGFVEFRDEEAGFRIYHPEDWTLQSPEDPEVRFLATPNARDSILVRVTPIDLGELEGEVSEDDFQALHRYTEEIVRGEDVEILDDGSVEIADTVASHYLYTFKASESGQRGAHSHFFIFEEGRMITLVLQTIPPQRYSELADTFEVVAQSFELLE